MFLYLIMVLISLVLSLALTEYFILTLVVDIDGYRFTGLKKGTGKI